MYINILDTWMYINMFLYAPSHVPSCHNFLTKLLYLLFVTTFNSFEFAPFTIYQTFSFFLFQKFS